MNNVKLWIKLSAVFILLLIISACSTRRDIQITLNQSLVKESIRIDFVGTSEVELNRLNEKTFEQYWNHNDLDAKNVVYVDFRPFEDSLFKQVTPDNPIWTIWNDTNCEYIFIAVDMEYPGTPKGMWKSNVYLQSYSWYNFWSDRNLYIAINKDNLNISNK